MDYRHIKFIFLSDPVSIRYNQNAVLMTLSSRDIQVPWSQATSISRDNYLYNHTTREQNSQGEQRTKQKQTKKTPAREEAGGTIIHESNKIALFGGYKTTRRTCCVFCAYRRPRARTCVKANIPGGKPIVASRMVAFSCVQMSACANPRNGKNLGEQNLS